MDTYFIIISSKSLFFTYRIRNTTTDYSTYNINAILQLVDHIQYLQYQCYSPTCGSHTILTISMLFSNLWITYKLIQYLQYRCLFSKLWITIITISMPILQVVDHNTYNIDAILQLVNHSTYNIDAILQLVNHSTYNIDAILQLVDLAAQ